MAAIMSSRIETRPLSPNIGAEILGVDLSKPVDDGAVAAILDVWHAYNVILFRNQNLSEEDQVRFTARFGEIGKVINQHAGVSKRLPGVIFISNIKENGELIGALPDGEMMFHSDQCYIEVPSAGTLLYAMEVPSRGGDTLFANMYKAYEAVPADLKAKLEGRKALNVYDYANVPTHRGEASKQAPRFAHPIFRIHPATGRKALYVNRLMTDHIVDMDRAESDALLARLFDIAENPVWIYEHKWKVGDLVMWDNRCTLHARSDFDASERRLMRRSVMLSGSPVV